MAIALINVSRSFRLHRCRLTPCLCELMEKSAGPLSCMLPSWRFYRDLRPRVALFNGHGAHRNLHLDSHDRARTLLLNNQSALAGCQRTYIHNGFVNKICRE